MIYNQLVGNNFSMSNKIILLCSVITALIEIIRELLKFKRFINNDIIIKECFNLNIKIFEYKNSEFITSEFNKIFVRNFKINENLWCFYYKDDFFVSNKYKKIYEYFLI